MDSRVDLCADLGDLGEVVEDLVVAHALPVGDGRRVVAFLFTLATTGALVSATLGIAYIWAMLAPAALFSFYIVNIRRDERLRAEERYRRRQAALAAERRRERERQRTQPEPTEHYELRPQDYRRAANG